ncbi:MAG: methyltransferase, TIGR04325 family [Gammaproteobacteria bacterium]|jgi:putative methyltransferase (TIGR04325 family)|nr:hypothetical protein [Gammaproteobacteria bacterium]MDP6095813.1 methyltransferase, TIGR04325 family [Gammaproteobacteria bacterium]
MDKPIWEGVYQDIGEIKAVGAGFSSNTWVDQSKLKVEQYLADLNDSDLIPPVPIRPTSLPLIAAMAKASQKDRKDIIDFGGGLGFSYLSFVQSCSRARNYDYHIIESSGICDLGRESLADHDSLFFHESIADLRIERAEILYINSVLQYIADWKSLLGHLLDLKPEYVLLDDLPAGEIPTFATAQNYYESKIPRWFFNVREIVSYFESRDYCLEYKSTFVAPVLGKIQEKPMSHFPARYRLAYPCTLLFSFKTVASAA